MWFWLRNQIDGYRNAKNSPRRKSAPKQSAVRKVKLLTDRLEERALPTVYALTAPVGTPGSVPVGTPFLGANAIQNALNTYVNDTTVRAIAVDDDETYNGFVVAR